MSDYIVPMNNNKFVSELYELIDKWINYGINTFKGRITRELFREIQVITSKNPNPLFIRVKNHMYNGGIDIELIEAFNILSSSFDYDYLPYWIECHQNDKTCNVSTFRVEVSGESFILPESKFLKEFKSNFRVIMEYLNSKNMNTNIISLFLIFLEHTIPIIESRENN